jgi:chemotaxis signal transduction protein
MTYRDDVIHVFNLRKILGYKGFEDETLELIKEVEKGHKAWVEDFKDAVFSGTPFTKTFDPHACVLGKWIDKTVACLKCNNQGFVNLIKDNLIQPHNKLHNRGTYILSLEDQAKKEELFNKETKLCLKECIDGLHLLEKEIKKLVFAFERVIIYKDLETSKMIGLTIDDIEKMIEIKDEDMRTTTSNLNENEYVTSNRVFVDKKGNIVPILNLNIQNFIKDM